MKFTCHYKIAFKCCSAAPPNAPQETVVGLTISASGLSFFKMMIYYYCSTLLAYLFKNASIFPLPTYNNVACQVAIQSIYFGILFWFIILFKNVHFLDPVGCCIRVVN